MSIHSNTLFVSAFSGEIDLLLKSGKFPHLIEGGIGNINCLLGTNEYLSNHPEIKEILFIGSAGSYPWSEVQPGSFVASRTFYSLEISSALGLSKQIEITKEPFSFPNSLSSRISEIATKRTFSFFEKKTTNAPSTLTLHEMKTPPEAVWSNLDVENLELYGLAALALRKKISLEAVLAVTNSVGKEGSVDWQKNWREMSNTLQTFLLDVF